MKWLLALALGVAACGGGSGNNNPPRDAGTGSDAGTPVPDAGAPDAAGGPFASCLDRPDQADTMVPRPPTAGLSCDLIPPTALH
jgi:hypothetical protein